MKKPYIIEFTGTPEAGKTTTIAALKKELMDIDKQVRVIEEVSTRAETKLIENGPKKNLYIALLIMKEYLDVIHDDYDYIIIDRGLYDRCFWNQFSYERGNISKEERVERDKLIYDNFFDYQVDLLISLMVSEETAIARKGGEGSFVTKESIVKYNKCLFDFLNHFTQAPLLKISTDENQIVDNVREIKQIILK